MKSTFRSSSKFWLPALLIGFVVLLLQGDQFGLWKSIQAIDATKWSRRTTLGANAAVLIVLSFVRWRPNIVRIIRAMVKPIDAAQATTVPIGVNEEIARKV